MDYRAAALVVALCAATTAAGQPAATDAAQHARQLALDDPPPEDGVYGSLDPAAGPLRRARDALMAAGEYQPALLPAEELVTTLRAEPGPLPAHDLIQLARIQSELDMREEAERNLLEAVDLLARAEGELALSLVEPYHALGRAYLRADRHVEALAALQQARHVSQRHLGLFNLEQTELLDDMTAAHLGMGDTREAERLQRQRLENALRRYGAGDARIVPYRHHLAHYYERSRLLGRARRQYLEIIELGRETDAGATVLLPALRNVVRIDLHSGERDTMRALLADVLAAQPEIEPSERALSLAVLGDWALVRTGASEAHKYYRQAYQALASVSDIAAAERFAAPVALDFVPPLTAVDQSRRTRPYAHGTITLAFSVSADGRPWDVRTVEADPPGLVEAAYVRRLRETHFRPRLIDGQPVATSSVELTHRFRHYVDD